MILKILRLTLHSGPPMHGDASKLRGFFATSESEHALLHQHVKEHKGKKAKWTGTMQHQVSNIITAKIYDDENSAISSSAPKRGRWNLYGDCAFTTRLPDLRANG